MNKKRTIDLNDPTDSQVTCYECGGHVCICDIDNLWTAHCMKCDNSIFKGIKDPSPCTCAQDAKTEWEFQNSPKFEQTELLTYGTCNEITDEAKDCKSAMKIAAGILLIAGLVILSAIFGHFFIRG